MKPKLHRNKNWSRGTKLSVKSLLRRYAKILAALFLIWSVIEALFVRNALVREAAKEPSPLGKEKVFVTSIHWTNEAILRSHWIPAVVELAKAIGRENVYISIQGSASLDNTLGALRTLDAELERAGISRRIVLDTTTHQDEISKTPGKTGWIETPRGKTELRRIPYLAKLRNLALEPLFELKEKGLNFDKVLFLNDVVFNNHDVQTLLSTRGGEYAAACSLDFKETTSFYDTFALRDADGHNKLMKAWPFFRSHASRRELKAGRPVPVQSCWNGIVAMDAEAFYGGSLHFRGIADSLAEYHLEGSECCLIHADNPFSWKKGVWLNPNVRVGYNAKAFEAVHSSGSGPWVSTFRVIYGSWMNRFRRLTTTPYFEDRTVLQRLEDWKSKSNMRFESGPFCLINEMQVLIANGWAHV